MKMLYYENDKNKRRYFLNRIANRPCGISQLQSLDLRLRESHPMKERIRIDLQRKLTELKGLKALDYYLKFIGKEHLVLRDIRLADENGFFQLDLLIVNQSFLFIVEVKNWYGTIMFNHEGQVIRLNERGKEEGFLNPVMQVKLQEHRLQSWLKQHHFNLPVLSKVVVSFPSTILKSEHGRIPPQVILSSQLVFELEEIVKRHEQIVIDGLTKKRLIKMISDMHRPREMDVLKKYRIRQEELVQGVFCNQCAQPSMEKTRRYWLCKICGAKSKDAHLGAIVDYKNIIDRMCTNKSIRKFMGIESRHVMKRLLEEKGIKPISTGPKRKYIITDEFGK